ncbi:MAG: AEC family transporter, partial [Lachnospiraceae bacterium]|nr:AEC family transporter [Lachnospiraceae bacterium]
PIKTAAKNILRNPIIIAIFLGIPFALFDVEFPQIVTKTMGSISCLASPLALLAIGAGFEGKKAIKKLKPTLIGSSMKLIIQPLLFLPVAVLMGFRNQELMAILIMLGSPTTSTSFIMAKQMKNDATLSASIVVVTTLVSAVTLTLWIYVLKGLSLL